MSGWLWIWRWAFRGYFAGCELAVACSPKGSRLMQALLVGGAGPPTLLATLEALGGANFVPLLLKCVATPSRTSLSGILTCRWRPLGFGARRAKLFPIIKWVRARCDSTLAHARRRSIVCIPSSWLGVHHQVSTMAEDRSILSDEPRMGFMATRWEIAVRSARTWRRRC